MEQNQRDLRPGWIKARDEGRELTWQQQLAERTKGVVRLPNLMTATGVGLTILGARYASQNKPVAATFTAAASFAMDMEGSVARHFDILDPVNGARTDQMADMAKAAIVASTLLSHDIMPRGAALLTYGPKLVGAAAGVMAKATGGKELASSKLGKTAEVCRDIVPLAFLAAAAGKKFDKPWLEKAGAITAWTAVGAAATVGITAAVGYVHEAMVAKKSAGLSAHPAISLDRVEN